MYAPQRRPARRQPTNLLLFTGLNALRLIGLGGLIAAAIFWWPVQNALSSNQTVALAYTAGLVLAPPALWSFVIPWSPGGMLLQRIQARTVGLYVVFGAAVFFTYYSFKLQSSWWLAQPGTVDSNLVYQQVMVGLLLYIIIPGLIWTPISPDEFETQVKQDQLVKRYEMQTKADIAILDATLLRAQQRAAVGFANLLPAEREELAGVMTGLITGMDDTLQRIAGNFNEAAETIYGQHGTDLFSAPPFASDFADMLDYISESISGMGQRELPPATGDTIPVGVPVPAPALPAGVRGESLRFPAEYQAARGQLRGVWSDADLAKIIGKDPRTARDRIKAWRAAGLVDRDQDGANSWYFTEREEGR